MSTVTITKLPPGNARGSEPQPQFTRNARAARSTRRHDGSWDTTGLNITDVMTVTGRMSVETHSGMSGRKKPIPEWALNGELTRQVICEYIISRVETGRRAHRKSDKTTSERFTEACETSKLHVPALKARLATLCEEVRRMSEVGAPKERLDSMKLQVKNVETSIKLHERGLAAVVTAIVYLYYFVQYNSVKLAEQFGLTPVGVRQILFRLDKAYWYIQHPGGVFRPGNQKECARTARKKTRREELRAERLASDIDAELNEFIKSMTGEDMPSEKEEANHGN